MKNTATARPFDLTGSIIQRRTFEAATHPPDSAERARLNLDPLTSEYLTSHRYLVRRPALMSDGTPNPAQRFHTYTCRTKTEALDWALVASDRDELLRAAKAVRQWAEFVGGWEAPCWGALDRAIRRAERRPGARRINP